MQMKGLNLKLSKKPTDYGGLSKAAPVILVIDDDAAFAYFIGSIIHGAEFQSVVATAGGEGLRLARTLLPSLVLCDLSMPGLSGVEVFRMLRDDPLTTHIPRVLMSGYGCPDLRAVPADAFIAKPIDTQALKRLVRAFTKPRNEEEISA
jgi:CheY-like chemotaxis protein